MKNIWVPLSGQIAQQQKVDTIANNIANANTAGFKKDSLTFKEYLVSLDKGSTDINLPNKEFSPDDFYRSEGAENAYVKVDGSYTNFEQGALKPSNNPLDIALNGKGFFEVLTPSGIRFTRKGNFSLSAKGEVVTDRGYKLLSRAPEKEGLAPAAEDNDIEKRILKIPPNKKISISKEGDIFNDQGRLATISIVEFKDLHALRKQGSSLFINNAAENINRTTTQTTANQGFIEGSNVNALREMSELINAHRHFENIQKAINTYDAISGKEVNDIARF